MAILNAQIDTIGQSGVVPTFIYLQTNDTVSTVMSSGYLNGLVKEGLPISEFQVAVVITKLTPNARDVQTNLYSIVLSSGEWSLVPLGGSSGGSFYTITGNSDLTNSSFLGSTDAVALNVGTNGIVVMRIDDAQDVIFANIPDFEVHASATMLLASPSIQLTGPASVSPVGLFNVVADASGHLSFSNVANSSSGTAWDVGGNSGLSDPSVLGTLDAAGINIQTNATNAITISSAQVITMPALTVAPGGQKILMVDPTTFQLYISP